MPHVTSVVIGAGHSGLAVSRHLAGRGIDHVVLERGEVANSWRTQRWDSLRLLTPNWMTRLPDHAYRGDDPDGYLAAAEVTAFVEDYAKEIAAPVRANTTVVAVRRTDDGYAVETDQETWHARTVVLAAGGATVPSVPELRDAVPDGIEQRVAGGAVAGYRSPDDLPDGGVLVVGPSASGIQIAQEVQASGRPVTLAVGEHVRMPRLYRGQDVLWWMDATGLFDDRYDEIPDLQRARVLPSMQLVGTPERATLDLNALTRAGVQLVGRLAGLRDGVAQLSGSLPNVCTLADLKVKRLLATFDEWAATAGAERTAGFPDGEPVEPTVLPVTTPQELDLRSGAIRSIVWATGLGPDLGFLGDLPVWDRKGRIRHDGGVVTASPGLYVIGLPFLRRRKSTLIDGAGADADDIVTHLAGHLAGI
ncbi:NAD(P)-binding domain-containing protein [Pseudonocardia sp. CA-107938]|uniref:NAD(P)-binding domain-containing protein n=1 Tax=Pseudonocardia sp. CA-107938 TaxID=3240021 RepID=UPI003D9434B2